MDRVWIVFNTMATKFLAPLERVGFPPLSLTSWTLTVAVARCLPVGEPDPGASTD